MPYQPAYVLLIAVALALVLPEPGRWNPLALAQVGARALARDLPKSGPWAIGAGILLLGLIAAPALVATWALTSALPVALRLVAPDASPIVALILAAAVLRLTFHMPPLWAWVKAAGGESPRGHRCHIVQALGAEFAAPVMLFALLGIYAPLVYGIALEVSQSLGKAAESEQIGGPALVAAYVPGYVARRLVLLFATLASGGRGVESASGAAPIAATIAFALLVTIW